MSLKKSRPVRALIVGSLAAALCLPAVASIPEDGGLDFQVLRGDSPLGEHRLSFIERDGALEVLVTIDLEVTVGPFTFFRYSHENREIWRDGQLVSLVAQTDDDGAEYFVRAEQTPDGIRVETKDGTQIVPAYLLSTSYWNYEIVEAERLIDTQKGKIREVSTDLVGQMDVWVAGEVIPARHYRMTGDLEIDLWYDDHDEWVKTAFEVNGEQIEYFRGGVPDNLDQVSFFAGEEEEYENRLLNNQNDR
ncbi:DUF6134 family protein [Algihabitans albus]|uniref:DUF6134 family protein n=1 Tax=Algihabitans albus TaxID=2164067 RepID=UPI000E5CA527|nr:DUF6134 family protein [Algihabitans albus]